MTDRICSTLNLPTLSEALKEHGIDIDAAPAVEPDERKIAQTVDKLHDLTTRMTLMQGTDHTDAMDELYKEILTHARDLMAYGFNIDSPRARGIFEIAGTMYGHAMNAANFKRDFQIKTMRLALDKKKVDLEEKRTAHMLGQQAATISDNTITVEDRNELIKRLRSEMKVA